MYLDEQPFIQSSLEECTKLVLSHKNIPLVDIFGEIDSVKFRSSMTLLLAKMILFMKKHWSPVEVDCGVKDSFVKRRNFELSN